MTSLAAGTPLRVALTPWVSPLFSITMTGWLPPAVAAGAVVAAPATAGTPPISADAA